jgi:hypothetical protein
MNPDWTERDWEERARRAEARAESNERLLCDYQERGDIWQRRAEKSEERAVEYLNRAEKAEDQNHWHIECRKAQRDFHEMRERAEKAEDQRDTYAKKFAFEQKRAEKAEAELASLSNYQYRHELITDLQQCVEKAEAELKAAQLFLASIEDEGGRRRAEKDVVQAQANRQKGKK